MSDKDIFYLARRMEQELELAERAASPEAAATHAELASAYRTRLDRSKSRTMRAT